MFSLVFSVQACSATIACIAGTLSAPVGAGVVLVGGAIAGAVFLGAKLIDAKASK